MKDKALVMEGGDKNLTAGFGRFCVILSMKGKGRKSQTCSQQGKNCFLPQTLPVLFFLSILTSHFLETKMMETDKK